MPKIPRELEEAEEEARRIRFERRSKDYSFRKIVRNYDEKSGGS